MIVKLSRKEWCKKASILVLGGMVFPSAYAKNKSNNVIIGIQTYSFRDKSLEGAIGDMQRLGIKHCELWEGHLQPKEFMWKPNLTKEQLKLNREGIAKWRANVSMNEISEVRDKINKAGIKILAYNSTFKDNIKDEELDLEFRIAGYLGTDTINSSATVKVMPRVDEMAQKYRIRVGIHNHSQVTKPNEFSTPDSFSRGMEGRSGWIGINLDIGHFTAANFDPLSYLQTNYNNIYSIHIKDRIKNQGARVPFGEGDTPIKEILQFINEKKLNIPAFIEYEYPGEDTLAELKKCLTYCLASLQ